MQVDLIMLSIAHSNSLSNTPAKDIRNDRQDARDALAMTEAIFDNYVKSG